MTHTLHLFQKSNNSKMIDFRPISLCNVLYKIVSKVLANRLKKNSPPHYFSNQSAFIFGRLMIDNILAAYETLHMMSTNMKRKLGYMDLKLDLSKAYDRVECSFLEGVMRKLGFDNRWIQLIMKCINSLSYSILINGEPNDRIIPTRSLRQGDPLSPYLFILCVEPLSSLLQQVERFGDLTGIPIARGRLRLSHLFFCK